jgi:hypothetical protein
MVSPLLNWSETLGRKAFSFGIFKHGIQRRHGVAGIVF